MKKIQLVLASLAMALVATASAAPVVIDNFTTTQTLTSVGPGIPPNNPVSNNAGTVGAPATMIGGARNIGVTRLNGDGFDFVNVTTGLFELNSAAADNAYGRIIWDGDTNSTVNATGLGGSDLTGGGSNLVIRVLARSDLRGTAYITVMTGPTSYSTIGFMLPGAGFGATPFSEYYLFFTNFAQGAPIFIQNSLGLGAATGSASFSNVGAITLFVDGSAPGSAGLDAQIQLLEASAVPEPGTFALVGGLLVALGAFRRFRR